MWPFLGGALTGVLLTIAAYNVEWLSGKVYELLDHLKHRKDG